MYYNYKLQSIEVTTLRFFLTLKSDYSYITYRADSDTDGVFTR